MTTYSVASYDAGGLSLSTSQLLDWSSGNIFSQSATQVVLRVRDGGALGLPGDYDLVLSGGFTFTAGILTGGVVTGVSGRVAGSATVLSGITGAAINLAGLVNIGPPVTVSDPSAASVFAGTDILDGNSGADILNGFGLNDTITGGGGADIINGGSGDDTIIYHSGTELVAGEIIDGGAGTADILRLDFATEGTVDFRPFSLLGIERLEFAGAFVRVVVTLNSAQMGGITHITGHTGADRLVVFGSTPVDLSSVTFVNWSSTDAIALAGDTSANIFTGSNFRETIDGVGGADIMNGGGGDDLFRYLSTIDAVAGEILNGGAGTGDQIGIANGIIADLSLVAISNVEQLDFILGNNTAILSGTQIGAAAINAVDGSAGIDSLFVSGSSANLSTVTFTNWTNGVDSITIDGTSGIDSLTGSDQNDRITGGGNADFMSGGNGDDTFVFAATDASTGETINGGLGTDTIEILGSNHFALHSISGVERLDFAQTSGSFIAEFTSTQLRKINGTVTDAITAVDGSAGSDALIVTGSDVTIVNVTFTNWTAGIDTITINGTAGIDLLNGSTTQRDIIFGGDSNDRIFGRGGQDTLNGEFGDDTFAYFLSGDAQAGEVLNGGDGTDTIELNAAQNYVLSGMVATNVERLFFFLSSGCTADGSLFGSAGSGRISQIEARSGFTNSLTVNGATVDFSTITFTGWDNASDTIIINGTSIGDILIGSSQNDNINGAQGSDTMSGGLGNDQFTVDSVLDVVTEAAGAGTGIDTINSSVSYTIAANVEFLQLTGAANINATGLDGKADTLIGNSGDNILDGKTGSDKMIGGLGNDTYFVGTAGDIVDEVTGGGGALDIINASVSYTITNGVERLQLTGTANINATGLDAQADTLIGNSGNNIIDGKGGGDLLRGGLGNDTLTGGTGNDIFRFDTALNAATNMDTITDFNVVNDTIQLENQIFTLLATTGTLAANLFKNLSLGAQDADDCILYDDTTGAIFYDTNGLTAGGQIQFAMLTGNPTITNADFVVM